MAQKNVAETDQGGNMTAAEVKAVLDRSANRIEFLLYALRQAGESGPYVLRGSLRGGLGSGIILSLTNVWLDLKSLNERLYPKESGYSWDGPDLSCELPSVMSLIGLIQDHSVGYLDFIEKAPDRALLGLVDVLDDILGRTLEISAELEVDHVQ